MTKQLTPWGSHSSYNEVPSPNQDIPGILYNVEFRYFFSRYPASSPHSDTYKISVLPSINP